MLILFLMVLLLAILILSITLLFGGMVLLYWDALTWWQVGIMVILVTIIIHKAIRLLWPED